MASHRETAMRLGVGGDRGLFKSLRGEAVEVQPRQGLRLGMLRCRCDGHDRYGRRVMQAEIQRAFRTVQQIGAGRHRLGACGIGDDLIAVRGDMERTAAGYGGGTVVQTAKRRRGKQLHLEYNQAECHDQASMF